MAFISANGTVVESYQVEQLQKAVAEDLESTVEEVSVDKLLEEPVVQEEAQAQPVVEQETQVTEEKENNGSSEAGDNPENSEETQS